ncbi:MAG: helix-turn-helix domain-containing protein [Caldilineaceae bacterium]|nr:helix-turn-helix domain-containing protein [Caldilineaceae bacterium]
MNAEQSYSTYHAEPVPTIQELGVVLRERREALGASLAEVETATRIRQKYLAALESDDWHLLPGEIVGRGFLRNYATYLGLDQTELVERRRAVADPGMASTLVGTSAASPLPPERNVDYRPKDVALKDEPEGIQQREIRTGPIFTVLGLFGALFLIWWLMSSFGSRISTTVTTSISGMQTRVATAPQAVEATAVGSADNQSAAPPVAADIDTNLPSVDNSGEDGTAGTENNMFSNNNNPQPAQTLAPDPNQAAAIQPTAPPTAEAPRRLLIPTDTPGVGGEPGADNAPIESAPFNDAPVNDTPVNNDPVIAATPVDTNAVTSADVPPTLTPTPVPPTPTDTPVPEPTATFTPAPPLVIAPACPDPRAAITSPGINQTLAGAVAVTGSATHEAFQYYKLEYAFGADATEGFVYFDGAQNAVQGGTLGIFNTPSLPNGAYTLQLTVVDLSANYPPPCRVTVTIAN